MSADTSDRRRPGGQGRARLIALTCLAVVAGMVGLSYAAVPLYRMFCQVTGYGGTTQVAEAAPAEASGREMTVRFDANTAGGLSWNFRPVAHQIKVRVGESAIAYYRVRNYSAARTGGAATFNVTPLTAGRYFNKIDCFCFTEQFLDGGVSADLPVSFFIDPEIEDDPELDDVSTITLSYTYFPIETDEAGQTPLDAAAQPGQANIN